MTTRKALIERIQSMQLGTQEMLDAAKDDATLIPFDTLFVCDGIPLWRTGGMSDDKNSVLMGDSYYCATTIDPITED